MQELKEQFIQQGLTLQQANEALQAIAEWLHKEYPVAGVLLSSWMKSEAFYRPV
jgi:hypothetical protein